MLSGHELHRGALLVSAGLSALLGNGCTSYTERTAAPLGAFQGGHFDEALAFYASPEETGSEFLSGAEAGTVALTAGRWDEAMLHFGRAVAAAHEVESRALIGAEALGETLATWALNDSARVYQGEGFERVYVHTGLAMAYLALGKIDDVYVEARLANRLLESEEELYDTQYEAGGWGHLISALTYELIGEPDQAYIDYQRMAEKGVGTALAGRALVRLAGQLGRADELARLVEEHGPDVERPADAASVVVLAAVGLGPYKVEGSLTLPSADGLIRMAVPSYVARGQVVSGVRLVEQVSGTTVLTDVVEQVTRIAKENLEDRIGWVAAKSIARGLLKRELTKVLEDEYDLGGRIAGDLFLLFSERADLRAWLTLPDSYQACRMFVPPGVRRFRLEALGGEPLELGTFELDPGETMLVFTRTLGTRLHAHVIGGKLVETLTTDSPPSQDSATQ